MRPDSRPRLRRACEKGRNSNRSGAGGSDGKNEEGRRSASENKRNERVSGQ